MDDTRPVYRVSADRLSASRRVRYVEHSFGSNDCQLCQLDTSRFPDDPLPASDAHPVSAPAKPV